MATYEYPCGGCNKPFSIGLSIKEHGNKKIACPKCGSRSVKQKMASSSRPPVASPDPRPADAQCDYVGRTRRAPGMIQKRQRTSGRRLHVGTSGWVYPDWVGPFYPEHLAQKRWLDHYQRHYRTVELNVTFYRLPREAVFHGWAERARVGFRFAVKGPRTVTHYRRLRDTVQTVTLFLARARLLGEHLGPILWQLPPGLGRDDGLLVDFIRQLPLDLVHAFEFRNTQWFTEPVYAILREHGAAFVIWHMPDRESPVVVTSTNVYLRFHGTTGLYRGGYTRSQLAGWAKRIRAWLAEGRNVWAYFNNDVDAQAAIDARRLIERVTAAPRTRNLGAASEDDDP